MILLWGLLISPLLFDKESDMCILIYRTATVSVDTNERLYRREEIHGIMPLRSSFPKGKCEIMITTYKIEYIRVEAWLKTINAEPSMVRCCFGH